MAVTSFSSTIDGIKYFVANYGNDLIAALTGSGLYFAVAVAQQCLESGYGTSDNARLYNNFGGIYNFGSLKGAIGTSPKGFAILSSPKAYFDVYVSVLHDTTKKYIANGLLTATTPQQQLMAIAMGGYCEDPPGMGYYNAVWPLVYKTLLLYNIGRL